MASPIVNIKILADATKAVSALDKASGKVSKVGGAMKALPIAAAGVALYSMGKAAVEDAAGQAQLAKSLANATGATKDQAAAVEDWISKTAAASGVADDTLRPALGDLARATGDVSKAQGALGQALDIAAATGKPVAAVAAALAKGYGGSTTALGKLVPGLNKGVLATKDMAKISAELARLTGGASADAANTAAGQYQRMKLAVDETQESIGGALLPVLSALAPILLMVSTYIQKNADVVGPLVIGLGALAAVVWAVNLAMAANPFTLVAIAIAALVAGVIIAYKKCETFRKIVDAAWRGIAAAASWAWTNVLRPVFNFIIGYVRVMITVWAAAVRAIVAAARAIGAAALWLWKSAVKPAIDFIVGYFTWWWRTVVSVKDKIVGAFNAVVAAVKDVWDWFGRLFDKISNFKLPKWLTDIGGKIGSIVGLTAGPAYVPAPTVLARGATAGVRTTASSPAVASSGAASTMSRLTADGAQVVVQVSDRRMVDLVNVQLRDAAMAAKRDLTRRQVVIV